MTVSTFEMLLPSTTMASAAFDGVVGLVGRDIRFLLASGMACVVNDGMIDQM